ncbi:hypothetical protein AGRA3207_005540 [Actinomadura graeca]|uniref:Uncharacterized protein n=1 Tax=Actinomadura graeca TaxID=2750812 RepID=A0ABX8QZL9_9ACTN|nr:hypothetical protein [Actinomadura graeca]QXJ24256.1 hypothetical protein AGRA3207_005540 [Actinomadura graeca]
MSGGIGAPYLDLLARVLATEGWAVRRRYEQAPPRLRVLSPGLPAVGESVTVETGEGGVPWFVASTGDPLAPCHDLPGAVAEIGTRLAPQAIAAAVRRAAGTAEQREPPRWVTSRVRTWQRRM